MSDAVVTEGKSSSSGKGAVKKSNGKRDIDHGWAWVTFVSAFLCQTLISGHTQNSGIFFTIFLDAFERPRTETMWIMAVQGTTNSLAGALAGILVTRYGARTTMIVGSLSYALPIAMLHFVNSLPLAIIYYGISGIGIPLLLTSIIATCAQYFEKHLYVTVGMAAVGAGFGTIIIGVEMEWALETFGWRTTMLMQSAIVLQICVCGCLIFDNSEKSAEVDVDSVNVDQTKSSDELDKPITKPDELNMMAYWFDSRFVLQTLGFVAFTAGRDITSYIMKDFGVSSTLGRLASGVMTLVFTPPEANVITTALCTLGILLLILSSSMPGFLLAGIAAFGFFSGQQVVYQKQCWGTIFGRDVMAALYGYSYVFTCIPRFAVPPIAGFIKDATASYAPVVVLAAATMLMSAICYAAAHLIHKRKSTSIYAIR